MTRNPPRKDVVVTTASCFTALCTFLTEKDLRGHIQCSQFMRLREGACVSKDKLRKGRLKQWFSNCGSLIGSMSIIWEHVRKVTLLGLIPDLLNRKLWEQGRAISVFPGLPRQSPFRLKFQNHQPGARMPSFSRAGSQGHRGDESG